MFWKNLLCFTIIIGVVFSNEVKGLHNNSATEPQRKPFYELPCLSFGGICLQRTDCPEGKEAPVKGLCPRQQKSGIECCYSLSSRETRCRMNGGECIPKSSQCPERLTFGRATDCANEEKCCILVRM